MKIGLTLSGGGFRATIFHLGVLARLAEENHLEDVTLLSTVSGGSLCAGLVYAKSDFRFPNSSHLIDAVIPQARAWLTTQDLQLGLFWRALQSPLSIFESKAEYLSELLRRKWGVTARLRDLPANPRWLINATCYETARNWRFEQSRMGDDTFGYSHDTDVRVSDAITASSGFPGLIGALPFDARRFKWFKYVDSDAHDSIDVAALAGSKTEPIKPAFPNLHLWDGGVYDNLGLEGVVDPNLGWRLGIDFLIVSDAAEQPTIEPYQPGPRSMIRIVLGVMMMQLLSLRSRMVLERIVNHRDAGVLLKTGNTCRQVLTDADHAADIPKICPDCLSDDDAARAANAPTMIGRLSPADFELLFRHGFEVADYTLYAHYPKQFKYIGYSKSRWGKKGL